MIKSLTISNFRNIIEADSGFSKHYNVFYGQNGSGKTSYLEAIYFLSRGKSFRCSNSDQVVSQNAPKMTLCAKLSASSGVDLEGSLESDCVIGLQKVSGGSKSIRINGDSVRAQSVAAKHLPVIMIGADSYRLFTDGPAQRRQYLDWGVFHMEPQFQDAWGRYQRALRQRNAVLKAKGSLSQLAIWTEKCCSYADRIHGFRQTYTQKLGGVVDEILARFLPEESLKPQYERGWEVGAHLADVFAGGVDKDYQLGYTQFGPHRADYQLYAGGMPAQDYLSQGQQKLSAYACYLAQGMLYRQDQGKSPVYLIDDLPSELDEDRQKGVMYQLSELSAQVFVTGIERASVQSLLRCLPDADAKVFHVKHGSVTEPQTGADEIKRTNAQAV